MHALTALLLLVVVAAGQAHWATLGLSVAYAVIYWVGYGYNNKKLREGVFIRSGLWLFVLTLVWVAMLPFGVTAVYLVFPLYFLYLDAMPDWRGIIAVACATAVSIVSQYPHITGPGILGPTVSALVTITITFAFRALKTISQERQELIDELLRTQNQLAETERAAGMAAERQRIAHEIHDTLAQGLSSIQMLLHVAEADVRAELGDAPVLRKLELARHTAADNLSEARAMIAALQPAALSKTSLEGALMRVAQSASGVSGVAEHSDREALSTDILVEGDERQLPMKVEATLLRIAQGAMGNVIKHANAERCRVTLTYAEDEVRLDVVDNGVGFDPQAVADRPAGLGHIGLAAMRQRAAECGGDLTVESQPGAGCAVSVAIPLIPDDAPEEATVEG